MIPSEGKNIHKRFHQNSEEKKTNKQKREVDSGKAQKILEDEKFHLKGIFVLQKFVLTI